MRIVFHGEAASAFADGFAALLNAPAEIAVLPDQLEGEADRRAFVAADVIVGGWFRPMLPQQPTGPAGSTRAQPSIIGRQGRSRHPHPYFRQSNTALG